MSTDGRNSRRLDAGGRVDRARRIQFTFDGRRFEGFEGDTLASALLAAGQRLVARSWKYHRPRGIIAAGVEEPNALVQLFEGERTVPNVRMTEVLLFEGLVARSIHARPSLRFDLGAVNDWFSRLIPAGFYYKTFMASPSTWRFFEKRIRAVSGLGDSPRHPDPDRYDKRHAHTDVLVVGAGLAGLCAAQVAARAGARVILCDEQAEFGGWLLSSDETVDGATASQWVSTVVQELSRMPNVTLLARTTAFGYHDHDFLTLIERRNDHLPLEHRTVVRERLWKLRARRVVLATGAHDRPLVFARNDLPGIMLSAAVSTYVRRYAVLPGQRAVVFTNHDGAYDAALALAGAGAQVQVVDARAQPDGHFFERARRQGVEVLAGHVVTEARGRRSVAGAVVSAIDAEGRLKGKARTLACDLLAMSGGWSAVIHLHSQAGSKAVWNEEGASFLPGAPAQSERAAGSCAGARTLAQAAETGTQAGLEAAKACGCEAVVADLPAVAAADPGALRPLWLVPHASPPSRAPKQFVDFQSDVSASDLLLAVREGFESIEHVKRYTAMGFGTDQGKTGNINGMGIVAQALGRSIPEVGTSTFRPNYTPVSFGAIAGHELGETFDPVRTTCIHPWHVERQAVFEDVGQWKRPRYYPNDGEDMQAAVAREVAAARGAVATLDASTLGKIDIQGPDAVVLLNWVYCNAWNKLEPGKARYGLMLDENGMVLDDGVTVRLADRHYLMHTSTGGAARVLAWLERWLQTEWPHLKVYLTSVTDHWSTTAVVGPKSRAVLRKLCHDVDFDDTAFPFMSFREGTVAGIAARIFRISFSGERSYEVNVPAAQGLHVWQAIHEAGAEHGITPYGTEAMHVLRAEKGFIIVGQDTDGSVTPGDLGMGAMVAAGKDCLGKRSLVRSDTLRSDRKQFVGLLTDDPQYVLPEGAQVLACEDCAVAPVPMAGHVTSSYWSPTLRRSIALALVERGLSRRGERVLVATRDGRRHAAIISSPVFHDPKGERQHAS